MKSYDSRTYSINDFVEWDAAKQLELNPRFQRRPVWTEKAKSFLMDTIIRGKPIPKVFIRQKINGSYSSQVLDDRQEQSWLERPLNRIKRIPPMQPTRIHHAPNRSEQLRTPQ